MTAYCGVDVSFSSLEAPSGGWGGALINPKHVDTGLVISPTTNCLLLERQHKPSYPSSLLE